MRITLVKTDGEPFIIAGGRVDPASLRTSKDDQTHKLEPKAMAVLDYLACRPDTVVNRQELEDTVWAGTIVGYDAIGNAIIKLRKALGDKARKSRFIETIAKSGYRLIADINFEEPVIQADEEPTKQVNHWKVTSGQSVTMDHSKMYLQCRIKSCKASSIPRR